MNIHAVFRIAKHHCWESIENSINWFSYIKSMISPELRPEGYPMNSTELMRIYFTLFLTLLDMNDDCSNERIEQGFLTVLHFYKINKEKTSNWFDLLMEPNSRFKNYCLKKENKVRLQAVWSERKRDL